MTPAARGPARRLRLLSWLLLVPALPAQDAFVRAVHGEPGVQVGVEIQDLDGAVVYSFRGEQPMLLASNVKLLTTAAALLELGPDHRWRTQARLDGGRLWIRGGGDPSLRRTPAGDHGEALLDALAAALQNAEATALEELVLDDRAFDRQRIHPLWPEDQLSHDYSAPVSALAVEGNVLELEIGQDRRLRLAPELGGGVVLERRPAAGRTFSAVWTGDLSLRLSGDLQRPATGRLAMRAPVLVFGAWLRHGLEQRGIPVAALRLAEPDEPAPDGPPLLDAPSAWTLGEAVLLANKESDNFVAETLLRTLAMERGEPGSAAAGCRAVDEILRGIGVDTAGLQLADGSGYARGGQPAGNTAPPALLCAALRAMAASEHRQLYFDSLLIGGEEGRLARLFQDPAFQPRRVRAKTGWITGASSLSGYLQAGEQVLVFSVVVNYQRDGTYRTNGKRFREVQERILLETLRAWPSS